MRTVKKRFFAIRKSILAGLVVLVAGLMTPLSSHCQLVGGFALDNPEQQADQAAIISRQVSRVKALIERKGKAAFTILSKQDGQWKMKDHALYVIDVKTGDFVFHATGKHSERAPLELSNINAKPFAAYVVQQAQLDEKGSWLSHLKDLWAKSDSGRAAFFTRMATAPDGTEYAIALGRSSTRMELVFLKDLVHQAADLINRKGVDAFPRLCEKNGPFRFGDTYIYVVSENGVILMVPPPFQKYEGKALWQIDHPIARQLLMNMYNAIMGINWNMGWWPKPGTAGKNPENYFKLYYMDTAAHGDRLFYVGSGVYFKHSIQEIMAHYKQESDK